MKFRDGFWNMRPGVTPYFAVEAHEVVVEPAALTVYATTKRVNQRGDTLNQPIITIRYSSPLPNVIHVKLYHLKGGQPPKPEFEIKPQAGNPLEIYYNKTVFEVLEEKRGKGDAVVFARSATVGGQQFPAHWGGDSTASFESMAETLRGGLSLGLAGFGFWSHDIGGFEQTASVALYKRWCAFGLLSSHSRLHGSQTYRVPWLFDEESVEVLRFFTKLKCRLMRSKARLL